MADLKLAIIGCGQVTETFHLPAAALSNQVDVAILVDKSITRARQLADSYGVPIIVDNYREVLDKVDAAIVALPHHLHAPVTIDLLQHGIHTLVEKPMALQTGDCDEMIAAALSTDTRLAVGLVRRFYNTSQFVKQALESGLLGTIVSFDLREGVAFSWNAVSNFLFRKDAGGGVLADTGAHAVDLLLWWLGDCDRVEYYDDAMGGVESDCELHLELQSGATGIMELSRTRRLRNSWIIRGENGTLEVGLGFNSPIRLSVNNQDIVLTGHAMRAETVDNKINDVFDRQIEDFATAILNHCSPFVPGHEGRRAVELIQNCYASRKKLEYPWLLPERLAGSMSEGALL